MGAALAGFAYPAMTSPPPQTAADERYEARGNDPVWTVAIANGRMRYSAGGSRAIEAERPRPLRGTDGRRYQAAGLIVDISYSRCNDDLSGHGFEHQVVVTAGGRTHRGCGGGRRTDWDV
jgi:uncharacterized membrane protein